MTQPSDGAVCPAPERPGFEFTPKRLQRDGSSEASLIGRRLSRVYTVMSDLPREMNALLQSLDRTAEN